MNRLFATIVLFVRFFLYWLQNVVLSVIPRNFRKRKDITGQNVLITGAGNGVGRELAIEFSKHSVCLILLDIHRASLLETEKLLDRSSTSFIYECDVSKPQIVYEVADKIKKEVGNVDILVNNAGVAYGKYFLNLSDEEVKKTIDVNTLAHFWMCKAFLPAMIEKNAGHIVSIASIVGKITGPKVTDYCCSKFAAVGFAESLEVELRERNVDGIKVTIVCPCHIDTELFKGAKQATVPILTPRYVAEEVVTGVLENEETIYLPHYVRYIIMLKESFPRWLLIWYGGHTGDIKGMENFVGRTGETEPKKIK